MTSDNAKYKTSPSPDGQVPKAFNRGMTTLPASLMDILDPLVPLFPLFSTEQNKEPQNVVENS